MHAIPNEPNISRHNNGTLYFVARRSGKLIVKSLRTKDLQEAKRKVASMVAQAQLPTPAIPPPDTEPNPAPAGPSSLESVLQNMGQPHVPNQQMTLAQALDLHDRGVITLSQGTGEMLKRGHRVISLFASGWEGFDPVQIWKKYRQTGLKRQGKLLTSAANHLLWYFKQFVPWAIRKGYLPETTLLELEKIPHLEINPRRIRIPEKKVVGEFLAMVESEDPDHGAFLRFLACTGLRRSGANNLEWQNIDFHSQEFTITQKRSKTKVIPMTQEAIELLQKRRGLKQPWGLDTNSFERLERRMKRFAKGFDIDLNTFHSFRHYFASQCLLSGLTVQETAKLLGHSDDGQLVLKTYGHICGKHLKSAVSQLRLTA